MRRLPVSPAPLASPVDFRTRPLKTLRKVLRWTRRESNPRPRLLGIAGITTILEKSYYF